MPLEALLHSLTEHRAAYAAARSLYARRLAPDFNVFDFIVPDELRLSAILAWLLNPLGTHGQGALFLAEFLREMDIPWPHEGLETGRVAVEVETDARRRVDVLLRLPSAVLAIENKPFAADQPRQVSDYLAWLDNEVPQGRRCLVYLAGADGTQPSEGSITEADRALRYAAGELRVISYSALLPWLARTRGQCQADSVCAFVDAFARYIQKRFMGVREMTEREQVLQVVRRSPDNLRSALQLLAAANDIRTRLVEELADQLRAGLPAGFILARADASASRYTGFGISMPGVADVLFTLEFQSANFNWLVYGLRRQGEGNLEPAAQQRLKAAFGAGTTNQWWAWWRTTQTEGRTPLVQNDWATGEQPWLDVHDGTLADRIIAAVRAFHEVLVRAEIEVANSPDKTLADPAD